jgi:large subunit ribosomal protein L15
MNLFQVNDGIQKRKRPKRVGRGPGSGHGKTSGRGHKGQGQLAGWTQNTVFEGGRMPLVRRIPKRGFNNQWALKVAIVNVGQLEDAFDSGAEVTPERLNETGLVKGRYDQLKVLSKGDLTKKLRISAHRFSRTALEKIQKAGGEAVVLPGPAPVVKNKQKQ